MTQPSKREEDLIKLLNEIVMKWHTGEIMGQYIEGTDLRELVSNPTLLEEVVTNDGTKSQS